METLDATARKRLYLRASIKILVSIGFAFLLVPFIRSLPWPQDKMPAGSVFIAATGLSPGTARRAELSGQPVWVTRTDERLRAQLLTLAPALWTPNADEFLDVPYFVVSGLDADGEPVTFRAAAGPWPGGFVSARGNAWDVAGRAFRPGPQHPDGAALPVQNLAPMPFRQQRDGVLLIPPPDAPTASAGSSS